MIVLAKQDLHKLSGESVGCEILVRRLNGDQIVSPFAFMTGRTPEAWFALDLEVLLLVSSSASLMAQKDPLFINLSPITLENEAYFQLYLERLAPICKARAGRTVIEIPEASRLCDEKLPAHLHELEDAGAFLALDDFGIDFADQARLECHHWSYCKIDVTAVRRRENMDYLDSAIRYCNDHGIQTILEKVECKRSLHAFPTMRDALIQGFLYSRPVLVETESEVIAGAANG